MKAVEAALRYAAGGHLVLPMAPGSKVPLAELVPHGLKDATLEAEMLRSWWTAEPEADVAIRCDGLLVLDVDPGGEESLAALIAKHGEFPPTREQETRRGRHFVFGLPGGIEIGNSTRGLGRPAGLDIRAGARGYIVVAPTAGYRWANDLPIAPAPDWLVAALISTPREPASVPPAVSAGRRSRYGEAAFDAEVREVECAPEGQRNCRLNEAAFALGQLEADGELEPGDAEAALIAASARAGLPEAEARRTVRSGLDAGRTSPRSAPPRDARESRPVLVRPPVDNEPEDGPAYPARAGFRDDAEPSVSFVGLREYVATPKGSGEALIGDADTFEVLLPVGGLWLAYGAQGASKTTTIVDLVAHLGLPDGTTPKTAVNPNSTHVKASFHVSARKRPSCTSRRLREPLENKCLPFKGGRSKSNATRDRTG
jgi:hypothetical protein